MGIQYDAEISQCIPLKSFYNGWNWISFNQIFDDMSLNGVFEDFQGNSNYIKSQSGFADYYSGFGWFGTLEDIDNYSMYKLGMLNSDALALRGEYVDVSQTVFNLDEGWNWIGYSPRNSMMLNNALENINEGSAEYIKSQSGFADYYSGFGWFGTLEQMNPFEGFQILVNESGDFIYGDESGLLRSPLS